MHFLFQMLCLFADTPILLIVQLLPYAFLLYLFYFIAWWTSQSDLGYHTFTCPIALSPFFLIILPFTCSNISLLVHKHLAFIFSNGFSFSVILFHLFWSSHIYLVLMLSLFYCGLTAPASLPMVAVLVYCHLHTLVVFYHAVCNISVLRLMGNP